MNNKSPLKVLIVDDETLGRSMIRRMLATKTNFSIVGECRNGREALVVFAKEKPDLVFLDVQMPEMNGFEFIEALIGKQIPQIIFVTAYDRYAVRAFEVNALDYLLKPFDEERFGQALSRAVKQLNKKQNDEFQEQVLSMLSETRRQAAEKRDYIERFVIKTNGRVFFLKIDEIMWIKAEAQYVSLNTNAGKRFLFRQSIGSLEAQLDPRRFQRIGRGAIVNLEFIRELYHWSRGDYRVVLDDGQELKLSHHYRENLNKYLAGNL